MTENADASKRDWTDPDDAPELDEDWFAQADLNKGAVLVRRGGRPRSAARKQAVNIRLDADVLAWFKNGGPGWQSRINAVLRRSAGLDR